MGRILVIRGSDFSQNRIDKVTIIEKPKYLEQVEITIDDVTNLCSMNISNTELASIFYTLDGTQPSTMSTMYEEPFILKYGLNTIRTLGVYDKLRTKEPKVKVFYDESLKTFSCSSEYKMKYTSDGSEPNSSSTVLANDEPLAAEIGMTYKILCQGEISTIKFTE